MTKSAKETSSSSVSTETASPVSKQMCLESDDQLSVNKSFESPAIGHKVQGESTPTEHMIAAHSTILHERLDKLFDTPAFTNSVKTIVDKSMQKVT